MKKILLSLFMILTIIFTATHAGAADPYGQGVAEGFIKEWDADKIRIEAYNGTLQEFTFTPDAILMIDRRSAHALDFKPGMEVYAELTGSSIRYLEGYSTENPGYIPEGGKVRSGIVGKIDRDQIILKLPTGETETFFTSPATISMKKGENVPMSVLYEGDRVRLYFNNLDDVIIDRMEIEGDSILVKGIYRGKLAAADLYENMVTLNGVETYKNGKWEAVKSSMSLTYSDEMPIYFRGSEIRPKDLKYYAGKTVYMAVKSFFGTDRIERMILRDRYESSYSEKIETVNWFTGAFELSNHKNISFNEGTVVIKNGRLVDQYAINPGADAFIVTDTQGSVQYADVIYVYNEDINNSNIGQYSVYVGRLDEILQDRVTLKNFFLLDGHDWASYNDDKELFYDSETYLYDAEAKKAVTPVEFYSLDYSVDESSEYAQDHNLKDWYGYVYTDGDRIVGLRMQKKLDSLLTQRSTIGTIEAVSEDEMVGWTATLMNAVDWSPRKAEWMEKTVSTRVSIDKAMIFKNDQVISQDELKAGDRLYLIRDGFEAKVVIVK